MRPALTSGSRLHILGIGGSGMSALARILAAQGFMVTGSDTHAADRLTALAQLGIHTSVGSPASQVAAGDFDVLIRSTAVPDTDPALMAAVTRDIPIWSRADALEWLVAPMRVLAVAGTHGKTTTSSLLTLMLRDAGIDTSYIVGSELQATGVNAELGGAPWCVVEADESDGTFLRLRPDIAIVTNIDADHLDRWASLEALEEAFYRFVSTDNQPAKDVVLCSDDAGSSRLVQRLAAEGRPFHSYGFSSEAQTRIHIVAETENGVRFRTEGELVLDDAVTAVPGRHNVSNSVAAALVAASLGVSATSMTQTIARYRGARRRFELRGESAGIRVFDDYAHHPTAVAATLSGARAVAGRGRVIAVCQPYRWYRTAMFIEEYAKALAAADIVYLLDVYGPGEVPIPGKGSDVIASLLASSGVDVRYHSTQSDALADVVAEVRDRDIVLTLGGEDIRPFGADVLSAWSA